jgi:hypothetical protein
MFPKYDEFVQGEGPIVAAAIRKVASRPPTPQEMYHCAWRRLVERWTQRDILHGILNEPLEDGGHNGDSTPPSEEVPPADEPPPAAPLGINDPYFVRDNNVYFLRGLTSFLLPKLLLTGHIDEALMWMDWARLNGFNMLRCFSQVDWDGRPVSSGGKGGVAEGFLASAFSQSAYDDGMHQLFTAAAARDLLIELVAHTFAYDLNQMVDHLRHIDQLCAQHFNVLMEIANEPPRNHINVSELLKRYTPATRFWASGQYDPSPYPAGTYTTDHPPRDVEWPRKFKGAIELRDGTGPWAPFTPGYRGPVLLDEPIRLEDTTSNEDVEAFGAGSRLFAAGVTAHGGTWAQTCTIPPNGSLAAQRISALQRGIDAVPNLAFHGYKHPPDAGALRRYVRTGSDNRDYEIAVRPYSFRAL